MGDIINAGADLLGFGPASKAADAQMAAAQTSASAQLEAARVAAEAARFRPVGVTTGFGTSQFTTDAQGNLTGASYQLTPELQALRNRIMSQAGLFDTSQLAGASQQLTNLGQGYLSQSPEEARQRYISQQQALLAPGQEQQLAGIRNRLFQTGRTGLATGGTQAGSMAQTNPEMAAYYNSLAQQQAQIAAGAEQAAQQQQAFGAGLLTQAPALYSAAYSPLQTQLGLASSIEGMGQQGLGLGSELGGRASTAGANMGRSLLAGGQGAAQTLQSAGALGGMARAAGMSGLLNNPSISSSNPQVKNWFSSVLDSNNTASPFYNTGADVFSPSYMGGTSFGE